MIARVFNIKWDTDGEDVDLPKEVEYCWLDCDMTDDIISDTISDYLSDRYGYTHHGFDYEIIDEFANRTKDM